MAKPQSFTLVQPDFHIYEGSDGFYYLFYRDFHVTAVDQLAVTVTRQTTRLYYVRVKGAQAQAILWLRGFYCCLQVGPRPAARITPADFEREGGEFTTRYWQAEAIL